MAFGAWSRVKPAWEKGKGLMVGLDVPGWPVRNSHSFVITGLVPVISIG